MRQLGSALGARSTVSPQVLQVECAWRASNEHTSGGHIHLTFLLPLLLIIHHAVARESSQSLQMVVMTAQVCLYACSQVVPGFI